MKQWLKQPEHQLSLGLALAVFGLLVGFVIQHMPPYPIEHMAILNTNIALRAHEQNLTWGDISQPYYGHRHVIDLSKTALLAWLTGWEYRYEYVLVVANAFISWLLLVGVFAQDNRKTLYLALVPFALLMFATQQGDTWLIPHAMWQQSLFFFLLGWWALFKIQRDWLALVVMVGSFGLGLVTLSSGLVVMVVMLLGIVLTKRWRLLIPYAVLSLIMVGVYLLNAPFSVTTEDTGTENINTLTIPPIGLIFNYMLAYVGAPIAVRDVPWAIGLGGVLLGVALLNWGFLAKQQQANKATPWILLGVYAALAGLLTAGGRYRLGMESALLERYTVLSNMGWVGGVALSIVTLHVIGNHAKTVWQQVISGVNVAFLVMAATAYTLTAYVWTPILFEQWDKMPLADIERFYACTDTFPLSRTDEPGCIGNFIGDAIDRLAAYDMGGFQHRTRINVMPDAYQNGDPILLHSDNAWHTVHMRDIWLDGIPIEHTFHLIPTDQQALVDDFFGFIPQPPPHITSDTDLVNEWIGTQPVVWVMSAPNADEMPLNLEEYALLDTVALDYDITLSGYVRTADHITAGMTFEDTVTLQSWRILEPLDRKACEPLTLISTWQAETDISNGLKLTFVMSDSNGLGITRADVFPPIRADRWQDGETYAVRQTLTVPCEAEAGDYPLLVGAYIENGDAVQSLGGLHYLTTGMVVD